MSAKLSFAAGQAQANRFAIDLLAPWAFVDRSLSSTPDLRDAQRMGDTLQISLEAAVSHMIDRRSERLAAVFSKDGLVRYAVWGDGCPWIALTRGDPLPRLRAAYRAVSKGQPGYTTMADTPSVAWTGRPDVELWKQTRVGKGGTAITLLEADIPEEANEGDDLGLPELGTPTFRR